MKKWSINPVVRAILIIASFIVLVCIAGILSLIILDYYYSLQPNTTPTVPAMSVTGKLELISGVEMTGEAVSLSNDIITPTPVNLPLKALSDFSNAPEATRVAVVTSKGELELELLPDVAPISVASFLSLIEAGFYDGLKIHRVEPGFVVQVGDPASREATTESELLQLGRGYPGYRLPDEFTHEYSFGEVGMVGLAHINVSGQYPHTGGSQFFITLAPASELDGKYTILGWVREGVELLSQLEVGDELESMQLLTN